MLAKRLLNFATCPPVSIAMAGALNGPDAALGINIKNGVQLAIDKHNAANPGCQVQLKPFDTEGDPQKATAIAPQIVDEMSPARLELVDPVSGPTSAAWRPQEALGVRVFDATIRNMNANNVRQRQRKQRKILSNFQPRKAI